MIVRHRCKLEQHRTGPISFALAHALSSPSPLSVLQLQAVDAVFGRMTAYFPALGAVVASFFAAARGDPRAAAVTHLVGRFDVDRIVCDAGRQPNEREDTREPEEHAREAEAFDFTTGLPVLGRLARYVRSLRWASPTPSWMRVTWM